MKATKRAARFALPIALSLGVAFSALSPALAKDLLTVDLVNEPSNILTTNDFAARLAAPLQTHSRRFWFRYQAESGLARAAEQHIRLIGAILDGDEGRAAEEALQHSLGRRAAAPPRTRRRRDLRRPHARRRRRRGHGPRRRR